MQDAALMSVMNGPGQDFNQPRRFPLRLRCAGNLVIEAAAGNVLQREKRPAVVFTDLVDLDDVGML
jgi:hypothetical protein